jgi:sigma-B regulation protein RsbU (phosphoserine phosphatase)
MTAELVPYRSFPSAVPSSATPAELNGLRWSVAQKAASEVSGDFVWVLPRGDQLCVVIGDACGKGVPAARLVDAVRPHLAELASFAETPSELLTALNDAIAGQLPDDVFVTAAALFIDPNTGAASCANAGHVPPVLRRAHETRVLGAASGPPLGMVGGASYRDDYFRVQPEDILLMMTDGIVEALEEDLYEMPRVRALLGDAPQNLDEINHRILSEVARRATRPDDRAIIALELRGDASLPGSVLELPDRQAA